MCGIELVPASQVVTLDSVAERLFSQLPIAGRGQVEQVFVSDACLERFTDRGMQMHVIVWLASMGSPGTAALRCRCSSEIPLRGACDCKLTSMRPIGGPRTRCAGLCNLLPGIVPNTPRPPLPLKGLVNTFAAAVAAQHEANEELLHLQELLALARRALEPALSHQLGGAGHLENPS